MIAQPTHYHDAATKANQSTNTINQSMNIHVTDSQKKRGDGGKTHNKQRRLEVAPNVHKATVSRTAFLYVMIITWCLGRLLRILRTLLRRGRRSTPKPFYQNPSHWNLSQNCWNPWKRLSDFSWSKIQPSFFLLTLLHYQSESRSLTFECIDGSSRTFPSTATSHDVGRPAASTSTHSEPPSTTQAVPNLETSKSISRTGFKAFGIEVCPNIFRTWIFSLVNLFLHQGIPYASHEKWIMLQFRYDQQVLGSKQLFSNPSF